jgi:hypothetical protein
VFRETFSVHRETFSVFRETFLVYRKTLGVDSGTFGVTVKALRAVKTLRVRMNVLRTVKVLHPFHRA